MNEIPVMRPEIGTQAQYDVPGALRQGRTLDEGRENLKDAIALTLEPGGFERLADGSCLRP